jgi:8-amino-7-oxononanoate synthase
MASHLSNRVLLKDIFPKLPKVFPNFADDGQGGITNADFFDSASVINGLKNTRAASTQTFKHNNIKSLEEVLQTIKKTFREVGEGRRSIFIAMESIYSMDGYFPPVHEILSTGKESFPLGNVVFFIDEAHSHGILGPSGSGYLCHYGLEHEFAIRVHSK